MMEWAREHWDEAKRTNGGVPHIGGDGTGSHTHRRKMIVNEGRKYLLIFSDTDATLMPLVPSGPVIRIA